MSQTNGVGNSSWGCAGKRAESLRASKKECCGKQFSHSTLLIQLAGLRLAAHGALGLLDEALGHVAADVAGLTGRKIAVVALLEVDAQLGGDLILHLVERALGLRHNRAVAAAGVLILCARVLLLLLLLRAEVRGLSLILILVLIHDG